MRDKTRSLLLSLFLGGQVMGQPSSPSAPMPSSVPLRAQVQLGHADTLRRALVYTIGRNRVRLEMEGAGATAQVPIRDIGKINFYLDQNINTALRAIESKEYTEGVNILRGPVLRMMPFLRLPNHNLQPVMDQYVFALHQVGQTDLLREFYEEHINSATQESAQAKAWLAYLDAKEGRFDSLQDTFMSRQTPEDDTVVEHLRGMSFSRLYLHQTEFRKAIDQTARMISSAEISDLLYPEFVYLSAQAYEGLALKEWERLRDERKKKMAREMLSERIKIARKLERQADEEGTSLPTEQDILNAIDREAVEEQVPEIPELHTIRYSRTAQRLYVFLENVFPYTTWGQRAQEKILSKHRHVLQENETTRKQNEE